MEKIQKEIVLVQIRMMKAWSKPMVVNMEKRKKLRGILCTEEGLNKQLDMRKKDRNSLKYLLHILYFW